jgi:hypothetical protein
MDDEQWKIRSEFRKVRATGTINVSVAHLPPLPAFLSSHLIHEPAALSNAMHNATSGSINAVATSDAARD